MIMFLAVVTATIVVLVIGATLVKVLGWPTSRARLGRWLVTLLGTAVVFSMTPGLIRRLAFTRGLPAVPLDELMPALFVLAITALGYVAWRRDAGAREETRAEDAETRNDERRRADAPTPAAQNGAVPGGFRAVGTENQEQA